MLSRKYYRLIAQVIADNSVEIQDETTDDGEIKEYIIKERLINNLCAEFKADNNLFNREIFVEACE